MRWGLALALWAASVEGLSELGDRYRQLCAAHLQPDNWDEQEDGPWVPPDATAWQPHSACPEQLTADSFRGQCALHLQPKGWSEEEDGPYAPPPDLALPTCILLFVPHLLDSGAAGRMELLGALVDAASRERGKPLVYLWAEAGAQPELEAALHVGATYPKLVLYSPRLRVGTPLQLALTPANIGSFLLKAALSRLPVRPALFDADALASPAPWDLQDAQPPSCADEPSYDHVRLEGDV
ncbi:hypothetical protein KFE25_001751 [Diacronema lutheri]|uniref:Thioredoxin domain-containing protein n=2 Tax=Diacronema lutheri TaxID=2081491 RepID=A0A8J5XAL7_DIALT|nr:hypothetical protein KFE25_001751 [Diacronema lutheri]